MTLEQIAELMTEGFFEAAVEDATYLEAENGDRQYFDHVSADFTDRAADIVDQFLASPGVPELIALATESSFGPSRLRAIGADLYMSVAGHGVDFRDSDYPAGDALAEAAEPLNYAFQAYIGDDNTLYA